MKRKILVVGIIILLTVVGLSGCVEEESKPSKNIYILRFNAGLIFGYIRVDFTLANPAYDGEISTLNKLTYILFGNDYYVIGGEITTNFDGNKNIYSIVELNQSTEIYDKEYPYTPSDYTWFVDIDDELKNAIINNEEDIEWRISGEFSYYPPDSSELVIVAFEDIEETI